ncbi:alpha-N-acetylgalactosaminide alpha-2,6-sialyltransferase 3-like [Diadema setosum]|uniref:alpha-N-acetylgalactosaminide alpha-2,6-sialyltransferase 3-like n=1 Tax=Diadema setosum TaxID=31175 RepID=UPI003B3AF27A
MVLWTTCRRVMKWLAKTKEIAFVVICLYSLVVSLLLLHDRFEVRVDKDKTSRDVSVQAYALTAVVEGNPRPGPVVHEDPDNNDEDEKEEELDVEEEDDEEVTASPVIPGYFLLDSNEPFTRRCGRCALVSSSGHLYQSGAGADIDSADCVLRMNTAPVTGWTEDVGSRTDIRIIGHRNLPRGLLREAELQKEILTDQATRAKYIVVPWLFEEKINMTTDFIINVARQLKQNFSYDNFVFLTPEKHSESETRFRLDTGFRRADLNSWFSTGFVSMVFALDVCDSVHVYGLPNIDFCKLHQNSTIPYHYYEPHGKTECEFQRSHEMRFSEGHKFSTERAMFARWSMVYDIKFHYPSWTATIQNMTEQLDTEFLRKYREALVNGNLKELQGPRYIIRDGKRLRVVVRRVVRRPKKKP